MWYFAWLCFVFEKPSHDPSISQSEYEYIIKNQGKQNIEYEVNIPFIEVSLIIFVFINIPIFV